MTRSEAFDVASQLRSAGIECKVFKKAGVYTCPFRREIVSYVTYFVEKV